MLAGYKTYIACGMGVLSMLVDLYHNGPTPTNVAAVVAALSAAWGRYVAKV